MATRAPLEKEIQAKIMQWLEYNKIFAWVNKTQGTFDPVRKTFRKNKKLLKGVPDILGILPDGRFLGIEVKRPGGKVSPEQLDFIEKANGLGGVCFVAFSLEDVIGDYRLYECLLQHRP